MKKDEAERLVRSAISVWAEEIGLSFGELQSASFSEFRKWLLERNPTALSFRSSTSAVFDAELWFDEETRQLWRR